MPELLTLVDENDTPIGTGEKLDVHQRGLLHRAFSIFVFNEQGHYLLQKRSLEKYHSGGLWTNACCGHPRPHETVEDAAHRRLQEEMGFDCHFKKVANFTYRAEMSRGLIEHEYDHIFIGFTDSTPNPDPTEASDWRWVEQSQLLADVRVNSGDYTVWFNLILTKIFKERGKFLREMEIMMRRKGVVTLPCG